MTRIPNFTRAIYVEFFFQPQAPVDTGFESLNELTHVNTDTVLCTVEVSIRF